MRLLLNYGRLNHSKGAGGSRARILPFAIKGGRARSATLSSLFEQFSIVNQTQENEQNREADHHCDA